MPRPEKAAGGTGNEKHNNEASVRGLVLKLNNMAAEENEEDEESKKVSERQQPVKLRYGTLIYST